MKRLFMPAILVAIAALTAGANSAFALTIFADGMDNLANWTVAQQANTTANVVDYSALGIPEAPNMVGGSGGTTGVQFTANIDPNNAGAAAVNLIGNVVGQNADLALSTYQMQFDMWMNVGDPIPSGGTEQAVFGVGRSTGTALGRNNRAADGDGAWGWIAGENGYFSEDLALFNFTVEDSDIGDTNDAGADALFNQAFATTVSSSPNDSPANQWVRMTMVVRNGTRVAIFGRSTKFLDSGPSSLFTSGDVMVGYEDPFSSSSGDPANQFGIIDNVIISDVISVPEPSTLLLLGLGGLGLAARRKK